jgi:hypothetical protein
MNDNWRLIIVSVLTNAPAILGALGGLAAAIFSGVAAWHAARARKEMNGMKHELIQAATGQAAAVATVVEKERAEAHADTVRGTSEDRKVP